jgi:DNA-binding PadR family transcriptional regulator
MISQTSAEQLSKDSLLEQKLHGSPDATQTAREVIDPASKVVARELVDLEILYFLNLGPKSGYELKKNLMKSFNLNLSYGTLYPHLHALEKADFICGSWKVQDESQPLRKRVYKLTDGGSERLARSITTLSKIALTMQFNSLHMVLNSKPSHDVEETQKMTETAKELFTVQGYTAVMGAKIRSASGVEHVADVAATNAGGKERVLIKITTEPSLVAEVLKTSVMASDLRATDTIVIATHETTDEVEKLAKSCGVKIYSCKDAAEVASKLTPDLVAKKTSQAEAPKAPA